MIAVVVKLLQAFVKTKLYIEKDNFYLFIITIVVLQYWDLNSGPTP
jgi:hypothetical protein